MTASPSATTSSSSSHDGEIVCRRAAARSRTTATGGRTANLRLAGHADLAAWRKASGQERLDGRDVGFQVDPRFVAPGGGGSIDDAAHLGTLRAYDLLASSPLIGKGLDLQRLFRIAPGPCDFHGTPLQPGMKFNLGANQKPPPPTGIGSEADGNGTKRNQRRPWNGRETAMNSTISRRRFLGTIVATTTAAGGIKRSVASELPSVTDEQMHAKEDRSVRQPAEAALTQLLCPGAAFTPEQLALLKQTIGQVDYSKAVMYGLYYTQAVYWRAVRLGLLKLPPGKRG